MSWLGIVLPALLNCILQRFNYWPHIFTNFTPIHKRPRKILLLHLHHVVSRIQYPIFQIPNFLEIQNLWNYIFHQIVFFSGLFSCSKLCNWIYILKKIWPVHQMDSWDLHNSKLSKLTCCKKWKYKIDFSMNATFIL